MGTINIEDKDGNVIQININQAYPPDKDGNYIVCLRKYSYFIGKKTNKPVNITRDDILVY